MNTKIEKISHMVPFELERLDWCVCFNALKKAQEDLQSYGTRQSWLDSPVEIAKQYANRQYPAYQMHAWPTSFQAVDNFIIHREAGKVLLGKKHKEPHWRFPGGFVDPKDPNLETAAARERAEECGIDLECSKPEYLTSFRVPDPRYANSPDKIMSAIMKSYYLWGNPKAGDDIKSVRWFTKQYIVRNYKKMIMPCHHPLVQALLFYGYL